MWIQVRSMDGRMSHRINGLSKLTPVEVLRERISELFDVPPLRQRLYYRGKQFVDGHTLFDYNVGLNEIVQLLVKPETPPPSPKKIETNNNEEKIEEMEEIEPEDMEDTEPDDVSGATYQVGDIVDGRWPSFGSWYEVTLEKVTKNMNDLSEGEDGYDYHVSYDGYGTQITTLSVGHIRPRARRKIVVTDLKKDDRIMVNYHAEHPTERGLWYDAIVEKVAGKRIKNLFCTVFVGEDLVPVENSKIKFTDEVFAIEEVGSQSNANDTDAEVPEKRVNQPECDLCKDDAMVTKCKGCGCHYCKGKHDSDKTLICDECGSFFHIYCLDPPLEAVPELDEWFCPMCKNDDTEVVRAGEKLKESKKKSKMASAAKTCTRDWGRGMACAGRTKTCTIVPPTHFGPVPGVEVGMSWLYRVGASECGVHRPHVAGMHGQAATGSYSIVLSGGYEDDKDDGDVFTYTGSGGRDLSGNRRTAGQSSDQLLTRTNLALARNCDCKVDSVNGGTAKDWKAGKPVRVLRSYKGGKHSVYAPENGVRYDGIYKVCKYWREIGQAGFYVWRYELRRDDPIPAPWTKKGKKRIEELGFTMQVPDGYDCPEEEKDDKKKKRKRKRSNSEEEENVDPEDEAPAPKVSKVAKYTVSSELSKLIAEDTENEKIWNDTLPFTEEGGAKFLAMVEENFSCICCMDLVCKPHTTVCQHNICKGCLSRSFKSEVYSCPACRHDLGKDCALDVNTGLSKILCQLFPGYETGR